MKDKVTKRSNIVFYIAVMFLPNIFLFYLFNNNKHKNILYISHFAVLAIIFAIFGVLLFLLFRKITKSSEAALVVSLFSWMTFWLFEAVISLANWYSYVFVQRLLLFASLVAITIALLRFFRIHSAAISEYRGAFLVLGVTICVLFTYNLAPALHTEVLLFTFGAPQKEIHQIESNLHSEESSVPVHTPPQGGMYEIKTAFVIDDSLPKPDIYWIHMDEMMGFSAVDKYLGDAQDNLKSELEKRGFRVNEYAEHRAASTFFALSSLLSPTFHDSYLEPLHSTHKNMLMRQLSEILYNRLRIDGINLIEDIHPQHELFQAFRAVDYTVTALGFHSEVYFRSADIVYRGDDAYPLSITDGEENQEARLRAVKLSKYSDLRRLMTSTTPLSIFDKIISAFVYEQTKDLWFSIPEHEDVVNRFAVRALTDYEERHLYRVLYDSFTVPSPKLTYVLNNITHWPYESVYLTGSISNPSPDNRFAFDLLYLPNYIYAAEVMLSTIDIILEENPYAIIILQADHGVMNVHEDMILNSGYSEAQVMEMWLSVMSAVRIPQLFGGLDEPVDPLDITRLLINRYVGENYELTKRPSTENSQ